MSGVGETHTHTHNTQHTQPDRHTRREQRTETPRTPTRSVSVWGEESSKGQSAVATDKTDRTVKGWEFLPHPPRP